MLRAAETGKEGVVVVYSPYGDTVRLRRSAITSGYSASWIDPRTGARTDALEAAVTTDREFVFDPPGSPARGNDWVLVIDRVTIITT